MIAVSALTWVKTLVWPVTILLVILFIWWLTR